MEIEEKMEETESEKPSDSNEDSDKPVTEKATEETNGSVDKVEVKPSASISSDKYAALREIIGEPEPPIVKPTEEDTPTSTRMSPVVQLPAQSKPSAEVELLNLFSDTPPPSSPKKQPKKEEETGMSMDIFEEIKMLSTSGQPTKTKSLIPEDIFCPFTELKPERDESKDDGNWTKFDTGLFVSDRRSVLPRSVALRPGPPTGKSSTESLLSKVACTSNRATATTSGRTKKKARRAMGGYEIPDSGVAIIQDSMALSETEVSTKRRGGRNVTGGSETG